MTDVNKMLESKIIEGIEKQLSHQSTKIDEMATTFQQFAQLMARKEERDHHINESIKEIKTDVKSGKERIAALEKISSGDEAMRKIFWIVLTPVITVVVFGVLYLVVNK